MGMLIIFIAAVAGAGWVSFRMGFDAGTKEGYRQGLRERVRQKTQHLPTDADELAEVMGRIFWRERVERAGDSFTVFEAKTGRELARVKVSRKVQRRNVSKIDGVLVLTYPQPPSESEVRSDLSALLW